MRLSLCVLAAFLLGFSALAAPAPNPLLSGWDHPVNPDRDCKISRDNSALTIEMPGTDHDYDPVRERFNAPRLIRDIEGEFEMQMRVRISYCPSAKSTVKGRPSFVSAGFLLIFPDTSRFTCDRMEYALSQQGSGGEGYAIAPTLAEPRRENAARKAVGINSYAVLKTWNARKRPYFMVWDRELQEEFHMIWDSGWTRWPVPNKAVDVYLRLEQRESSFYFFISPDAEKWTQLVYHSGPPAKLKVGLAAYSTSSEPSKVRFDQLRITRGKKKES